MKGSNSHNSGLKMSLHRIQTLTDAIFALAMILMILFLEFPESIDISPVELHKFLFEQFQTVGLFAITFIILAFYWISNHQQNHYLRYTDQKHLWINILYLLSIVLIPYSNAFGMTFTNDWLSQAFYSLNIFLIGFFSFLNWAYATKDHRLVDPDLDPQIITSVKKAILVEPLVALLATIVAFVKPSLCGPTFLLVPIIIVYLDAKAKKAKPAKESKI